MAATALPHFDACKTHKKHLFYFILYHVRCADSFKCLLRVLNVLACTRLRFSNLDDWHFSILHEASFRKKLFSLSNLLTVIHVLHDNNVCCASLTILPARRQIIIPFFQFHWRSCQNSGLIASLKTAAVASLVILGEDAAVHCIIGDEVTKGHQLGRSCADDSLKNYAVKLYSVFVNCVSPCNKAMVHRRLRPRKPFHDGLV